MQILKVLGMGSQFPLNVSSAVSGASQGSQSLPLPTFFQGINLIYPMSEIPFASFS